MVQGLAFLSKKSWHTKNLNNQERVWIAEERKKTEAAKTKELQKQIQQELEQQELDAIAGKKKSRDRGIDWMYEHGPSSQVAKQDAEKKAEDYLLGEKYVPAGGPKGDLDVDNEQEGVNKVVSSAAVAVAAISSTAVSNNNEDTAYAYAEPSVKERNEAFRQRFEDPMFVVAQQAVEKDRKLERKKQLLERVTGAAAVAVDVMKQKKDDETKKPPGKKEKKPKTRHREEEHKSKKKKRRHHHHSSSSSSESDDDVDRRRSRYHSRSESRERSTSPTPPKRRDDRRYRDSDRDHKPRAKEYHRHSSLRNDGERKGSTTSYRRERSRSRSRSPRNSRRNRGSRSPSPDQDRYHRGRRSPRRRDHDDEGEWRRSSHRGLRSSEGSEGGRGGEYSSRPREGRGDSRRYGERQEGFRGEHRRPYEDNNYDNRKPPPPPQSTNSGRNDESMSYGLQGTAVPVASLSTLGPDQDLLRRRREEKTELKRVRESAAQRRRMTPEERAMALQEMESNARQYEQQRFSRLPTTGHEHEADADVVHSSSAAFLHDIQRRTHGIDGGMSLQDRLRQNRNTNQKSHESFL